MILKPRSFVTPISFALAIACVFLFSARTANAQQDKTEMPEEYRGRVRAPELEKHRGWLNTDEPLSLAALKGKVVLLDFWTYGCINCIHVIPDLKRLEAKYANQLVVIGVHSAKFENEKETDNIRQIILRYEIEHPVVNDADFRVWDAYAVRAWPTQILIDPAGYIIGKVEGEGNYETIDEVIAKTIEEFRKRGELNEQPLKLALERAKVGDLPLAFPGKILADAKADRLFIADSNHNRIVVTKLDGTFIEAIGTGERGLKDGAFAAATFYRPQGMALADGGDTLYVADTENHAIRRVDLKAKTVSTVAGTGEQSRNYEFKPVAAKSTALNSPWDLQLAGRTLYVAMAGPHQIWQLNLDKHLVSVFAGSGREARIDGARIGPPVSRPDGTPAGSAFAQPSGLATDGSTLYVADSESNIIRAISFNRRASETSAARLPAASERLGALGNANDPAFAVSDDAPAPVPEVRTLAGGDLFEFGDRDGTGDDARLQHPLGVLYREGALYIADTYNHKIKKLNLQTRTVKTFAGTGRPGQIDGKTPAFYEPGGLSVAHGKLYVADTNNHAVRTIDLKSGETTTLKLTGLRPPQSSEMAKDEKTAEASSPPNAAEIKLAPQRLNLSNDSALVVEVALPAGYHLNESAPQRVKVAVEKGMEHLALADDQLTLTRTGKDVHLPLRLPLRTLTAGAAELRVQAALYYCREDNTGTCRIKTLIWRVPVEVTTEASAPREIKAQGKIE
ncbi:MAG: redoxin domain-containing protein [Acidobacteriota bacterium]|nr:redoxin domain-containing protein [Acidobacteriota bacterium]